MTFRGALGPVPLSKAQFLERASLSPSLSNLNVLRPGAFRQLQLTGSAVSCLLHPFAKLALRAGQRMGASAKTQMEQPPGFPWPQFLHL